jgi:group I intron endonuclease
MIDSKPPSVPGVYVITNTKTGRIYIGKTKNIAKRFGMHRTALNCGRHHNSRLQAEWTTSGESAFVFRVHVLAQLSEIDAIERTLIEESMGDSCYNWSPLGGTGRPKLPDGKRLVGMSIRLTRSQSETLKILGMDWLRAEIDASPEPATGCAV